MIREFRDKPRDTEPVGRFFERCRIPKHRRYDPGCERPRPGIPRDLGVVGFDDLPVSRWIGPPLTTVRQPPVEMAEAAARPVPDPGRGRRPGVRRLGPATGLIVRGSTSPPPAGGR